MLLIYMNSALIIPQGNSIHFRYLKILPYIMAMTGHTFPSSISQVVSTVGRSISSHHRLSFGYCSRHLHTQCPSCYAGLLLSHHMHIAH